MQLSFLWPSDLITWVLAFSINLRLILCLSSWLHHSTDYGIRFSEPTVPGGEQRSLIWPVGAFTMLDYGIFHHQRTTYLYKAL